MHKYLDLVNLPISREYLNILAYLIKVPQHCLIESYFRKDSKWDQVAYIISNVMRPAFPLY